MWSAKVGKNSQLSTLKLLFFVNVIINPKLCNYYIKTQIIINALFHIFQL